MSAQYFDFHFHPMLKQFLSLYEDNYPSTRDLESLLLPIKLRNPVMRSIDKTALHILASQSSFSQIKEGNFTLGVANLVTVEYAIAATDTVLGNILKSEFTDPLDKGYFSKIINGEISYYQLFIKELNLYARLSNTGFYHKDEGIAYINILSRKNNTKAIADYTGTTLVLAMEGTHSLNRNKINHPISNFDVPKPINADKIYKDFVDNSNEQLSPAESLQHLFAAMWQEDLDLFCITFNHFSNIVEQPLATQAYGMDLLKHKFFYPAGNGLLPAGKAVISAAYEMTADGKHTPVLIDIKHMSLKTRLDFYKYRKDKYNLPIIATHVGVTGYSIPEWVSATAESWEHKTGAEGNPIVMGITVPPKLVGMERSFDEFTNVKYYFNPWTINLMNEDIENIMESGGLIGLIMDRRILGAMAMEKNKEYISSEYISKDDYSFYFKETHQGINDKIVKYHTPDKDPSTDISIYPGDDLSDEAKDSYREVVELALNILHILSVGYAKNIADPWAHMSLGTDYDGLIDPLSLSPRCSSMHLVEDSLNDLIICAERSYLHYNSQRPKKLLPRNEKGTIDKMALKTKIRHIMYDNGKDFIDKWYTLKL